MRRHDGLVRGLVLLALLAGASCAAGPTVTSQYENGRLASVGGHARLLRSGPWTDYFPSGAKECEGRYENDVQAGLWTWWFENGHREMEGRFENERREGPWSSWFENGALRAEGRFEGGFEEGSWKFHDRTGALEHEGQFELGQPVLRWTFFRPDGTVRETGNCFAGVRVGRWTGLDAEGRETETLYPMPAGLELVEERFADTTLKRTGFLREGTPCGRWISFHPGGALRLQCSFSGGAPNGSVRAWRADGSLLAGGPVRDGCVVGTWSFTHAGAPEELEVREARPRAPFSGDWSPADSADLVGWTGVETWLAEISAPRQPAPIRTDAGPRSSAPAPKLAPDEATGIPARAQPWTEYERKVLPALLNLYSSGRKESLGEDEYVTPPALRSSSSKRPPGVVGSAELVGRTLPTKRFTTADGGAIDLDSFRGQRNVLVTILRGFGGQVCVYCTAQTRALAESADKFAAQDTEVVVVFPGPASGLKAFLEAYRRTFGAGEKLPYALLYDADLALTRGLHIEDNIAVPTSLLLDREGVVRWAHVARDHADRPSTQEILDRIAELPKHAR